MTGTLFAPTAIPGGIMRRTSLLLPVLLAAVLGACSSPAPPSPPADGAPSKKTTAAPPGAESSPRLLPLGRPLAWQRKDASGHGTAKVLSYRQSAAGASPADRNAAAAGKGEKDGSAWVTLDVEVCAESGSVAAADTDFTLLFADGSAVTPPEAVRDDFPQPRFPGETQVSAGECTRGKVTYAVPADRRPAQVRYLTSVDSGDMRPWAAEGWAVPGGR
ncbi:hypothetical protein [Streptomyces sp. NPDC018045]|uniref:hypothetical protein n=1 Tax=Streptomyces sp. NPDC018045 TaxID=3365037 RepID=UPI00378CF5CA